MILLVLVVLARSAEPAEETPVPSAVIAGGFSFPEWDTGGVPAPWTLVNDAAATRRRIGPSTAPSESAAGYYALFAGSTGTRLL
jgi:hypothetical protein